MSALYWRAYDVASTILRLKHRFGGMGVLSRHVRPDHHRAGARWIADPDTGAVVVHDAALLLHLRFLLKPSRSALLACSICASSSPAFAASSSVSSAETTSGKPPSSMAFLPLASSSGLAP